MRNNTLESYINDLNEMAFFISSNIKNVLDSIPKVTKKEFVSRCQPGDIMVAFSPKKAMKCKITKLVTKIMATVQGSPYTTSKMVLDSKYAIGYGIRMRSLREPSMVEKYPIKKIVSERQELCLVRITNTTNLQRDKATNYMKKHIGLGYHNVALYKSAWNRFFHRKLFPFFKSRPTDPIELEQLQTPLFCSTVLAAAYRIAGYTDKFNNKFLYDTWPKDFILDKNTEKICRVDYKY